MNARTSIGFLLLAGLFASGCRERAADSAAPTQSPDEVSARLSTNAVHVGDPVTLDLRVPHPPSATVDWPRMGDGKKIVVRDQGFDRLDTTTSVARWTLMSYELGQHAVWSGQVAVVDAQGQRLERALPPLTLRVESILPEAGEQLRDPKGLAHWPRAPMTKLLLLLGLIGLVALLTGLLVRWWMKRASKPTSGPPPPPPHEKALQALAALEQRTDFATVDPEQFFVEVSAVARRYLEERFALRAPEQTTEEFIRSAASSRLLSADHQRLVEDFLVESDLVKFARHRPGADRMKQALGAAYRLVRETIPVAQPAPAPGGAA